MTRAMLIAVLAGALAVAPGAAAEDGPVATIDNSCPVPEGILRYDTEGMEYRVRLSLSGCDWYHGQPVVLHGSLVRDSVVEKAEDTLTVSCEQGAPPYVDDGRHHPGAGGGEAGPATPVGPTPPPAGPRQDVRPAENCVLDVHVLHPAVERAHYAGELRYPGPDGEVVETIAVDCVSAFDVGGCSVEG